MKLSQNYGSRNFKVKFILLGNNVVRVATYSMYESAPACTLKRKHCLLVKFLYNPFTLGEHQHSMYHATMTELLWLGMTLFQQKSIARNRQTFITQPKHMIFCQNKKVLKGYNLVLSILKKLFFVLGVAHGEPIFAQIGPKNDNFQTFQQNLFRTTRFQLNFLILIEFHIIFHWKSVRKSK